MQSIKPQAASLFLLTGFPSLQSVTFCHCMAAQPAYNRQLSDNWNHSGIYKSKSGGIICKHSCTVAI